MRFKVLKQDKNLYVCADCRGVDFEDLHIESMNPPSVRKFQVLLCSFRCSSCGRINGIKHTKLEGFLLDSQTKEVRLRGA